MDKIRTIVEYKQAFVMRNYLRAQITEWMLNGWTIVYIIPGIQVQSSPQFFLNPIDCTGGWTTGSTTMPFTAPPEPYFEVYMVKFNEEDVPCPTCSHLNPERLDREA